MQWARVWLECKGFECKLCRPLAALTACLNPSAPRLLKHAASLFLFLSLTWTQPEVLREVLAAIGAGQGDWVLIELQEGRCSLEGLVASVRRVDG